MLKLFSLSLCLAKHAYTLFTPLRIVFVFTLRIVMGTMHSRVKLCMCLFAT